MSEFVIVRTYSAGVHCGFLTFQQGKEVHLRDARRIWRWRGANTLNEVSLNGVSDEYSRISEPVECIQLLKAIQIIPCTDIARKNLSRSRWND